MGYNPRADWHCATSPLPQVTLQLDQFKEAREQARVLMIKAQQSWVKHKDTPKYKEGDLVWLEGCNLRLNQPTPKLAPRRHGPFKVVQVMSPVNYRLELPTQWSIHPVFHIDLLTPYRETITHGANCHDHLSGYDSDTYFFLFLSLPIHPHSYFPLFLISCTSTLWLCPQPLLSTLLFSMTHT